MFSGYIVRQLIVRQLIAILLLAGIFADLDCFAQVEKQVRQTADKSFADLKKLGAQRSSYLQKKSGPAVATKPVANIEEFKSKIQPILNKSCVQCHGPDTVEGNIRIDKLDPDLLQGKDVDWWLEVFAVVSNGEMPPPDEIKLSDDDRSHVIAWLSKEIQVASNFRRASGKHSSFRRMTRYEFNYAMQDLLGLERDFAKDLPPEPTSPDGFQNSSDMLHMSVTQLESYRDLARSALERATVLGDRPAALYWGISMKDASRIDWSKQNGQLKKLEEKLKDDPKKLETERQKLMAKLKRSSNRPHYKQLSTGLVANATWSYPKAKYAFAPVKSLPQVPEKSDFVAVIPPGRKQGLNIELGDQIPDQGVMRVRVRAARISKDERIPYMQLEFGWQASNEGRARMRVSKQDIPVNATPDSPQFYQWDIPLGDIYPRNSVRNRSQLGSMPNPSEYIRVVNSSVSEGDIQIDYVEITTPFFDQWPPKSRQEIFFESKHRANEDEYAREILKTFMFRAWRRKIDEQEIEQKYKLFRAVRKECDTFEQAVVEVLATVIGSPNFLYSVRKRKSKVDDGLPVKLSSYELATRLSLFLWSSIPDKRLLELARQEKLSDPNTLRAEVTRMLADPRAKRFSRHFVHQWLHLQILDFLDLKQNFGQYDPRLKESMSQEPIEFFQQILRHNESVLNFIHSDYAVVDERLAVHYRLPKVYGNHFRKVSVDANQKRGGIMTQAGLLTMNADGKDSHPLKRGIWLLESVLNDPPPPPPPAVPEIDLADPAIARMTLKQRIENHRNHAACLSCHSKIDPWGIAFENYDAVGRWREKIGGKPVDASSVLFNKQKLDGMDGLKRYLLINRQDQFVRAMVHKMTTYALGRPLTFADRSSVDRITTEVRRQDDRLATMIMQIVASDLFHSQ